MKYNFKTEFLYRDVEKDITYRRIIHGYIFEGKINQKVIFQTNDTTSMDLYITNIDDVVLENGFSKTIILSKTPNQYVI